ncbi:YeiH family protein [Salarchaeum sp. JOR-1]|uniref:YeiH family protein n=1 Tax=Salarchaeum sp. JOR-1 TaxID=2599399 RepID=UPI001198A8C6|nr:putative sulfate exporter family transporter [Salarchaeum sp. JOR-1]QDX40037.1 putative sulfate exporter family transporter [Salarchaeum sp. JOR-1]
MRERVHRRAPGLIVLVLVAALAVAASRAAGVGSPLLLAVAFGALAANALPIPRALTPGLELHGRFLEAGIVALGATLGLGALAAVGPLLLALVAAAVAVSVLVTELGARLAGLSREAGSLLAAGASVCGVSAVAAVAGSIDATEERVAYAAATVLVFDAVTLAIFPALGHLLALTPREFGVWAGLAMFSTGPVTAAGFAYGPVAGQWATVTKLVRNTAIGVLALLYALVHADADRPARALTSGVPGFLVGFVAVAALAATGILPPPVVSGLGTVSEACFLLAFAGLGFDLRLDALRDAGLRPILVVATTLLVVGTLSLTAVTALL